MNWLRTAGIEDVALRKESVDRNIKRCLMSVVYLLVALRKESVDRNVYLYNFRMFACMSLSARRAWIEMPQVCWYILH